MILQEFFLQLILKKLKKQQKLSENSRRIIKLLGEKILIKHFLLSN